MHYLLDTNICIYLIKKRPPEVLVGVPKSRSSAVVGSLFEIIKATLANGEDILISGFGKFCVKDKNDRRGRNPLTGEDMMMEARRVVTFKCSLPLKQKLNGKGKTEM